MSLTGEGIVSATEDPCHPFREEEESDESTEEGQQLSDKGEELSLKNIIYR